MNVRVTVELLEKRKQRMRDYLLLKVDEQDWHGVCDASNDIREIEAALEVLEQYKGTANEANNK